MVDTVALKVSYIHVLGVTVEESGIGRAISTFSPAEEASFIHLARQPNVYDEIVRSIAPSLSGDYTIGRKRNQNIKMKENHSNLSSFTLLQLITRYQKGNCLSSLLRSTQNPPRSHSYSWRY